MDVVTKSCTARHLYMSVRNFVVFDTWCLRVDMWCDVIC